jgi:hypothetical protein
MNAVPDEKQGVASAVNDTTREVGAAVGIAVAGSVLAAQYNNVLAPRLAGLPEQVREQALDSLAHALAVAQQMGPRGRTADRPRRVRVHSVDGPVAGSAVRLAGRRSGVRRCMVTRPRRSAAPIPEAPDVAVVDLTPAVPMLWGRNGFHVPVTG